MASYAISEELPITQVGDKVKISYVDDSNGTISIVTFDNLLFTQKITKEQEEKNNESTIIEDEENKITKVDPEANEDAWEKLTEEEKAKLLQQQE